MSVKFQSMTPEPKSILDEAKEITKGARRNHYGTPLENHTLTGRLWADYLKLDKPLSPEQVCAMNVLQKISRTASGVFTRDTWVDVAGFAENGAEVGACVAANPRK